MRIRLTPEGDDELSDAVRYLARQSERAAVDFLDDVRGARNQLRTFPNCGSPLGGGVRRLLLSRFPYQLVYRVEGDEIRVYAVAHLKRKPDYWQERIDE